MTIRVHVVGSSPRSGTTLLAELMAVGFAFDGVARHERPIWRPPDEGCRTFLSKAPVEVLAAPALLRIDPDLWFLHIVRDPRDVVVSRHDQQPDRYWTNLEIWKRCRRAARRAEGHPRFLTLRYEELVRDPDAAQDRIAAFLPFLERRHRFSDYHRLARPSDESLEALGGVRPLDMHGIGAWRRHRPFLVAQLARHGSVDRDLRELGYESDDRWKRELAGVEPSTERSFLGEGASLRRRLARWRRDRRRLRRYRERLRARTRGRPSAPDPSG